MRHLIIFLSLSLLTLHINAQSFTPQQKAYLYRITQKTPVLERNLSNCFHFNKQDFIRPTLYGTIIDYDAIEYYQHNNPDSLTINWIQLSNSAPGLIAEATTLLALYELNEELKNIIKHSLFDNELYQTFKKELRNSLPDKLKDKKKDDVITTVIHPSLPLKIKLQQLDKLKLAPKEQQKLMNQWRNILNKIITERSKKYFQQISPEQQYTHLVMPAAGEGSGTAGLLYETETHPDDTNKRWYGKAIGLFTYQLRVRKNQVIPEDMSSSNIHLKQDDGNAFHFSLWGLNSSFKPLVVITANNKSYHLFSDYESKELSPDPSKGKGISYIDRINQTREELIDKPLKELQAQSSLSTILEKEYQIKADIEAQLETLGNEIDSLQEIEPLPETAITYRRTLIESNLSNLTKKEQRIKSLEDKLKSEYKQLDNARNKIAKMEELLGPNPQEWSKSIDVYTFSDGVWFNAQTQDLIFPANTKPSEIDITLLSASYSLKGEQRDEVQLLVNNVSAPKIISNKSVNSPTETFQLKHYFYPDEFLISEDESILSESDSTSIIPNTLSDINIQITIPNYTLSNTTPKYYQNREREFKLPITNLGKQRMANAEIIIHNDSANIQITSSTDLVATRLSQLPEKHRDLLKIKSSSLQNNKYLATLRALSLLKLLEIHIDLDKIIFPKELTQEEIEILINFIESY
nr:hypothetical protein [uncultured Carboxylicivirga sp.]